MNETQNNDDDIIVHKKNQIGWLTINRPKANAIDAATSRKMNDILDDFEADDNLRLTIISGAGARFFSAGWDLKAAADGESADSNYGRCGFGGVITRFNNTKPIIALVNGMAIGGGFEIVLACDLVICVNTAVFSLPETKVGVAPDAGSLRLSKQLPYAIANEVLYAGKVLTADEAKHYGLVNKVVEASELESAAIEMANNIITGAPLAVAAIKQMVNASQQHSLEVNHTRLKNKQFDCYEAMLKSKDAIEGPVAFAEKREPKWQGK